MSKPPEVRWLMVVMAAAVLQGCAYVHIKTADIELHSITVLKDVALDPNGIASTTSSSADNIITGVTAFFAGFFSN